MIAKRVYDNILLGRKCIFCGNYHLYKLKDKRLKCRHCHRIYSLNKLRKKLDILYHFYLEISARKTSIALGLSYKSVSDRFMQYRYKMAEYLREQFKELSGDLELDESYFGGKRKGKRGRGAYNKAIVFGIVSLPQTPDTRHLCICRDADTGTPW